MYKAIIEIKSRERLQILKTELENLKKERFDIKVSDKVYVEANDAVALKTCLNTISKILEVYEKMESIK